MLTAQNLIDVLGLQPHPEGGFFRETYRSHDKVPAPGLPARFGAERSVSTAIYYMLTKGTRSKLHRIKSDEVWHFYLGGPLVVAQLNESTGKLTETRLGQDLAGSCVVQYVVPAGVWFGAYPENGTDYSLVGCTVAPGFDFADMEFGVRAKLLERFPSARETILRLTD
jgi:predicted cupin superfamily sugar epimerase